MDCNEQSCIDLIKKFDWLGLVVDLQKDEVAKLVYDYINTHKWLINETIPFEITFDQAVFSWYENAYLPMMMAIRDTGLSRLANRAKISTLDLIKKVSTSHYYLNSDLSKGYYSYEYTCREVIRMIPGHFWTKLLGCR